MESPPATLVVTHRSSVTEEQIDHLGHMNVRFYGVNAAAGTETLLAGLEPPAGLRFRPVDTYTRHHREQMLGANLVVRSGVVGADVDLRLYHELVNEDSDVLAATFVHRVRPERDGRSTDLPGRLAEAAQAVMIEIPAHGATRSISLATDPVVSAPSLGVLRDRGLAMRRARAVTAEECDADGVFIAAMAPGLVWAGEPVEGRFPEFLHTGPNGEQMGWASMETRMTTARLPRIDDRIQSFSAVLAVRDKILHNIMWAFDVDREDLLITFEVVNLAFDIGARRPLTIPDHIRSAEEALLQADLAPRVPA